jgi:hypothetical protein
MGSLAITVSVLDDLNQSYTLMVRQSGYVNTVNPTIAQSQAMDLTGATFSAAIEIVGTKVFIDIPVTVAGNVITLALAKAALLPLADVTARYYVTMTQNGATRRLWADDFQVTAETEVAQ